MAPSLLKTGASPGQNREPLDWRRRFAQRAERARHPLLSTFYGAGMVGPETPMKQVPMAALDLETGGLNPQKHGIVSLGLVPFSLARIRCRESWYQVVSPRRQLEDESVTIHQITHEELVAAPDLDKVIGQLLVAMAGRVMVVHFRQIERRFLDRALRERLGEGIEFPVIDTLELEARIHRGRRPGLIGRLLGRQPESIRLADSRSRYNLPPYSAHHALTDALATAELLQAQVAHRFSPDTPIGDLWL